MSKPPTLARPYRSLRLLNRELIECDACPRLVAWREKMARDKRRAYRTQTYWGLPVPGFGDPDARLIIVGLAPGAHGANRTGRMFTGDRSGEFLYRALHRAGIASQRTSISRDDGMVLTGAYIAAAVRCAPPDNKPDTDEIRRCRSWLIAELQLLANARVYLALGKTGYDTTVAAVKSRRPDLRVPAFGHSVVTTIPDPRGTEGDAILIGSYHVSQQNTQTGKLTEAMFDSVLSEAMRRRG